MFYQFNHPATADYFVIEDNENFSFPAHLHDCFELITVRSGEMSVTIDTRQMLLHSGESVLIFPHQTHALNTSAGCPTRHTLCIFSPKLVRSFASETVRLLPKDARVCLPDSLLSSLWAHPNSLLRQKGLLYLICDLFHQDREYLPRDDKSQGLIKKIFMYIEKNYKDTCNLGDLAAALGYDYAYLSRYFKRTTGMGFNRFVMIYRLNYACFLLTNREGSILECAAESGFLSIRSFNRNFKLHFGITPHEYLCQAHKS